MNPVIGFLKNLDVGALCNVIRPKSIIKTRIRVEI